MHKVKEHHLLEVHGLTSAWFQKLSLSEYKNILDLLTAIRKWFVANTLFL